MKVTRIDLQPLGGIAGDMFAAAMFDAFDYLYRDFESDLDSLEVQGLSVDLQARLSKGLHARHFSVMQETHEKPPRTLAAVSDFLKARPLAEEVREVAIGIYTLLAHAEAAVHGKSVDTIHFHEVSDWDSMVDIIAASGVIARLQCPLWRMGALPLGGGTVHTAHGDIPVPAPATVELLRNFEWRDDGQAGERVTPTGAAIVAYLKPKSLLSDAGAALLATSGAGCGSKELADCANILRVTAFTASSNVGVAGQRDENLYRLSFEIDDMTAEELADAMAKLRMLHGVADVSTVAMYGKKGRHVTGVRILVTSADRDAVIDQCFGLSSTLGVRFNAVQRRVLTRQSSVVEGVNVKVAQRPSQGVSAKVESDDLAQSPTLSERRAIAERIERTARAASLEKSNDRE